MNKTAFFLVLTLLSFCFVSRSQEAKKEKVAVAFFDGTVVAGYVDRGAFLNFTGPNINFSKGNSRFVLGMMPSLRFKEDNSGPTKNSLVTPNLGGGITYSYKNIAFQVPFYYNTKTATRNGQWVIGFGMGYRFTKIAKKRKNEEI